MAGAAVAALALGYAALAQPVVQNTFTGNECWNAGQGPGGPSTGFVCAQGMRGASQNLPLTIAGAFTVGGSSANTTPNNTATLQYGGTLLVTAAPSTAAVTAPPNPLQDGIIVAICNVTGVAFVNTLTFTANGAGQTVNSGGALATLAAYTCGTFQWNLANATWYRTR